MPNPLCALMLVSTLAGTAARAENVEITLDEGLDGPLNSYCLDIAGGAENVDPENGLQAQTCYSNAGDPGDDQVFATEGFTVNTLAMPTYDVCATLTGVVAGSEIALAACDDADEMQQIIFTGTGKITPAAAPEMCFTAAEETRSGHSHDHQIKDVALQPCSDALATFQTWRTRITND